MTSLPDKPKSVNDYEISDPAVLIKAPVVSVLMFAYNHGPYLAQAVEGVLAQQIDFQIELLIGEDFSTDNTREIALRYQSQNSNLIRVITADENVGVQRNWQRLVLAGRGEFLAHLDGDDYWLPGKLKLQLAYMIANPGCAAVYTNAFTVNEDGSPIGLFNNKGAGRFDLADMLRRGNFLNTSSMVFRSALKTTLLNIDGPFIDYRMHLRHARAGYLAQLEQPMVGYRVNSVGAMTSTTASNDIVRKLYWDAILDVPRHLVTDDDFAHGITDFLRRVISHALRTQRWRLLREWVPTVFKASPYGVVRTTLLTLASVIRATCLEFLGYFQRQPDGRRVRVRHRR
ncbi:MAG: glycosyltransferase [Gammaproteobacteria bacterium]